jgi:hypothetical protein
MMTVRFPTGVAVVYNDANYLIYKDKVMELYTKKDGHWVCSIPNAASCVVESMPACRVENAALTLKKAAHTLATSIQSLRECECSDLAKLKKLLRQFNARRWRWNT